MSEFLPPEKQGIAFEYAPPRIMPFATQREAAEYHHNQEDLLYRHSHEIPWEQWGVGSAKGYPDLKREMAYGETILVEEPDVTGQKRIIRNVETVFVFVIDGKGNWLLEGPQVMADGRMRTRRLPYISETMRFGETPQQAAIRALREESGGHIMTTQERLIPGEIHNLDLDHPYNTASASYPGLRSHKTAYTFGFIASKDERRKEYVDVDEEGVRTTHHWKPVAENQWWTPLLQSRVEQALGHNPARRRLWRRFF